MINIVQIGANKGNDDLSHLIGENQPNILVLVEPMLFHNENLKKFYEWVNNLFIENVVIDINSDNEIDFYYHLDDGPGYEVASLDPKHIYERHTHLSKDRISSIKITTLNINDLFKKYNLKDIDILFIDAEGHDDEIIKSIDFDSFNIKKLYFENLHIKDIKVYDLLKLKNYNIIKNTGTNGWCDLAIKLN
jgi:FkbM family methyltransferase